MSEGASQVFVCPSCGDEELPDEVGTVKCECGATIETYLGAGEGSRPSLPVAPDGPE